MNFSGLYFLVIYIYFYQPIFCFMENSWLIIFPWQWFALLTFFDKSNCTIFTDFSNFIFTWFIMLYISCATTLNTASLLNFYLPQGNAFWQPTNMWTTLASSFPQEKIIFKSPTSSILWWCQCVACFSKEKCFSYNITLPLRPLSLEWLLHCFCLYPFTFYFPNYFQKFSAILLLLAIKALPHFYISKFNSTNLCDNHNVWHFYSCVFNFCFNCNFPLLTCVQL